MPPLFYFTKRCFDTAFRTTKNAVHTSIALIKKRPFATIASIAIVMYSLKKARERYRLRSSQVRKAPTLSQQLSHLPNPQGGDRDEGKGGPKGGGKPDEPGDQPPGPPPSPARPGPDPPEEYLTMPAPHDDDFDSYDDEGKMRWLERVSNLIPPKLIVTI